MSTKKKSQPEYEFFGPPGVSVLIFALPLTILALTLYCGPHGCPPQSWNPANLPFPDFSQISFMEYMKTPFLVYVGWILFQVVLFYVVPGPWVKGIPLRNKKVLLYKMNAHKIFWISLAILGLAQYFGIIRLSWVYDNFLGLILSAIIFATLLSIYLYISPKFTHELLAEGGNTGNMIYDFWIGHPLNPRIGNFDLKSFFELRPGLIGWTVINLAMAAKQYETIGEVQNSMILICAFQMFYVWDALFNEPLLLSTMDITTEGFGYMLAFGDIAWVPFTYSLQTRYLVDYPQPLSWAYVLFVLVVHFIGFYIFRGANAQKDTFRRNPSDPSVKHLKTLQTQRGTKLIISGWWGTSRHINYFGDWIMGISWCLPCQFGSVIPYFYVFYFGVLLIHRQIRDEHACQKKYGDDWNRYCKIVRWKIIPYIY